MSNNKTKLYEVNGEKVRFNFSAFKLYFSATAERNRIRIGTMEQKLADEIHVTKAAVHQWRSEKNGPGSIELINDIATCLGLSSYYEIVTVVSGDLKMEKLTERQLSAAKRIFNVIIDFLHEFKLTDGFNNLWHEYAMEGKGDIENLIEEYANDKFENVCRIYNQEYFDLSETEIYTDFEDYIYDYLQDVYVGKCSYAYRFESVPGEVPTTLEDYTDAMNRLYEIVNKYLCK